MSEERNAQVVEEICKGFDIDFGDDEKVEMLPTILRNMAREATSPKLVIAFLYNPVSGEVALTTPNIPPNNIDMFNDVAEGCMEAAKQYSKVATQLREAQKQQASRVVESQKVPESKEE